MNVNPARPGSAAEHSHALLYLLILMMVLFWSLNYIIGKFALREFPALLLSGLRVTLAGFILLPVFAWDYRNETGLASWGRKDLLLLVLLGVVGVGLNQLSFVVGLSRTSVAHASILMGMTPIIVLGVAALNGLESITARKVTGMAVALAGVAVLNHAPPSRSRPTLLGDLCIFVASLTFALFTVYGKKVTSRYRTITVNTFAYAGGAVMLIPLTLWQSAGFAFGRVSWVGWASLFYMAAFPSVLAYLIYYHALTKISASRVSAFSYLQPLVATILALPLLGESISGFVIGGGSLVFAGVYLAERT